MTQASANQRYRPTVSVSTPGWLTPEQRAASVVVPSVGAIQVLLCNWGRPRVGIRVMSPLMAHARLAGDRRIDCNVVRGKAGSRRTK